MDKMTVEPELPDSQVTISQCSVRSIPSDDDSLPVIPTRSGAGQQVPASGGIGQTVSLRYTYNNERGLKHTSYLTHPQHTADMDHPAPSPIHRVEQPQSRAVFLPRLAELDHRMSPHTKIAEDHEHVHLPEINVISRQNARFALHRSITDLLDPETEILNKIKNTPRKKRKKRKQRTPYPGELPPGVKIEEPIGFMKPFPDNVTEDVEGSREIGEVIGVKTVSKSPSKVIDVQARSKMTKNVIEVPTGSELTGETRAASNVNCEVTGVTVASVKSGEVMTTGSKVAGIIADSRAVAPTERGPAR